MNIAPKTMHPLPRASVSVRAAIGSALACGCLLGGAIDPAWADSGRQSGQSGRRDEARDQSTDAQRAQQFQQFQQFQQAQQAQQFQHAQSRRSQDVRGGEPRQSDPRAYDGRADESRRGAEPARRSGRLTPDERRDLRRQINEASQDIYAAPPRR